MEYLEGKKAYHFAGYVMIYAPMHPNAQRGGWMMEHRLVMEVFLGRYLRKEEIIHHINEIKDDNRIHNLMITDRYSHGRLHNKYRFKTKEIKELYIEGLSVRQIGEKLGIGKSTVHAYCKELGITRTNKKVMN